jgi:RNA polymerase sigma-70 factor (sigma-E family)
MTTPRPRPRPDRTIEEVARLLEESSLGTAGARQLRDRADAGTVAAIRVRAYFAGSSTARAWWHANQHSPEHLRRKAHELAACGETQISDMLTRLASDLLPPSAPASTGGRPQPVPARQEATADWRSFEAFYHRETGDLIRILRERAGLSADLARELIGHAAVKAFDNWEDLAASGDPGEWLLGCALQIYRSRELPGEDGSWAPDGGTSRASNPASPRTPGIPCPDARVAGALAVAASQVPDTHAAPALTLGEQHSLAPALCPQCAADTRSRDCQPAEDDMGTSDEALATLYKENYRPLVRLAALLVLDIATAEEVVQDSFIALHAGLHRLRDKDKALAYLRAAVVNRSRSVLRHRVVVDRNATGPQPDMPSAEHSALALIERSAVVTAIRAMPARQREALVLKFYADLSEPQIAAAMGISRGAVKSHTSRAMRDLRHALEMRT